MSLSKLGELMKEKSVVHGVVKSWADWTTDLNWTEATTWPPRTLSHSGTSSLGSNRLTWKFSRKPLGGWRGVLGPTAPFRSVVLFENVVFPSWKWALIPPMLHQRRSGRRGKSLGPSPRGPGWRRAWPGVLGSSPGRVQGNPQDERRRRERDT